MRKIIIVLMLVLALFLIESVSAVNLFYDNFEATSLNWTVSHLGTASDWVSSTTNPFQGTRHAQSQPLYTTEPASVMQKNVSTLSYQNIVINYSRRLIGLDTADEFQVEWWNGTGWTTLEQTGSASANDAAYVSKQFSLPSSASNNANFAIKFECTAGATSEYCRVDNFNISGDLMTDITPPQFSNYVENLANNSAYVSNQVYRFNVTITETNIASVWIEFNGVNYTNGNITSNGNVYVFNRTNLGAGSYSYKWWANDSYGNLNNSGRRDYAIGKAVQSITSLLNGVNNNLVVSYSQQVNASYSGVNYTALTIKINLTQINIAQNYTFGAGNYFVNYSAVGNQNYSGFENYLNLTINKATPILTFLANSGTSNLSLTYPQQVNITAKATAGTIGLDKDSVNYIVYNGLNVSLGVGSYIYRANITGNQNYIDAGYSYYNITINKALSVTNVLVNPSSPIIYNDVSNFSCSNSANLPINLYINDTNKTSEMGINLTRAAGNYIINCTSSGNENYTGSSEQINYLINKASQTALLSINESSPIIYGTRINTTCNGDLYRNNNLVNSEKSQSILLGAGNYDYSCQLAENENYSYDDDNLTFVVDKAMSAIEMYINGTTGNQTGYYGTETNVSITLDNSEQTIILYKNGIDDSANLNVYQILGIGAYNFTGVAPSTQNYSENRITRWSHILCQENLQNTSWSEWINSGVCKSDDLQEQVRNITQYDSNSCGYTNTTFYEYQNIGCDYCTQILQNTTKTAWQNQGDCRINDTQLQNRSWTEYDLNSCGEMENITYWEYRETVCDYCSYNAVNSSFSEWQNISCLINDLMNQSRHKTEYDENYNSCYAVTGLDSDLWNFGENKTYYEYKQEESCDYCTPIIMNTSWSEWENISCIDGKMNQSRFLTQYDANNCGEILNQTIYEYINLLDCVIDVAAPVIFVYSPENKIYNASNVLINFTADDYQSLWYFNGTGNKSYSNPETIFLGNGNYEFIFYANDSSGNFNFTSVNFEINITSPEVVNLSMSCEAGGVYKKNSSVVVYGNMKNNGLGILGTINIIIIGKMNLSESISSYSDGNFIANFSGLGAGMYLLNVSGVYNGNEIKCADSFNVGGEALFVLDKIASIENISDLSVIYNITLRLTNIGESSVLNSNLSDGEIFYNLENLSEKSSTERSYLKNFTRLNETMSYQLGSAMAEGIDEFSGNIISANSTSIGVSIPKIARGKQISIMKNVFYVNSTLLSVIYNVSSVLYNSGDENLDSVSFVDSDINNTAFFVNLSVNSFYSLSNLVEIQKAASNAEHEFALGTATVSGIVFYSNRPKVIVPGYGGPADVIVYAPYSVYAGNQFNATIKVINANADAGQDFVIDYFLMNSLDVVYDSEQKTVYVPANGRTNTEVSFTAPLSAGIYKVKAIASWAGGNASGFDNFEVISSQTPSNGGGSSGGGSSGGSGQTVVPAGRIDNKSEKENICNFPYIRYEQGCCLDENINNICDNDEAIKNLNETSPLNETKKSRGITGFFIGDEEGIGGFNYRFFLLLVALVIVAYLIWKHRKGVIAVFKRKRGGENKTNRLKSLIKKKVYSEDGIEIGKIEDLEIEKNKISKLRIKLAKKKYQTKGMTIDYKHVKNVGEIVIIDEGISEILGNREMLISNKNIIKLNKKEG